MAAVLRMGSHGADVTKLQELLNQKLKPSPNLDPDGDFGMLTDRAVRSFQRQSKLDVDGIAGNQTWVALGGKPAGPGAPAKPATASGPEPAWMRTARAEIGQKEVKGSGANSRIIEYHASTTLKAQSDEVAWCASFVNWVLKQNGIPGTNSAAAISWATFGDATIARAGAIAVIHNAAAANSSLSRSGNHVGFLVEETTAHYVLLGGNQSDSVKLSNFPKGKWQLKGMRWPKGK